MKYWHISSLFILFFFSSSIFCIFLLFILSVANKLQGISKDGGDFSLKDDFLPSNFSFLPLKIIQQKQM